MIEKVSTFKARLNEALFARDMKPVDLSRRTKISESTISQYRSGYAEPKEEKLAKIADALKVNPAWLMGLNVMMEIQEQQFYEQSYHDELIYSRLSCYSVRDYWAYHILEVGDALPSEARKDIEIMADILAQKYNIKFLSPSEVKTQFDKYMGG